MAAKPQPRQKSCASANAVPAGFESYDVVAPLMMVETPRRF